jgi:hypothetical protein
VTTTQIAPTILNMLRYDPNQLAAVRLQGTTVLPNLVMKNGDGNSQNDN